VSLQSSEAFDRFLHSACGPRRKAMKAERQRFTFRQTRRTVPITFSIMLVQAPKYSKAPRILAYAALISVCSGGPQYVLT
jgi:hypothetical protein